MKKSHLLLFFLPLIILISCAKVYTSPEASSLTRNHKTFAVLPPVVAIPADKKLTPEENILKLEQEQSAIHQEMVSWFLKRKQQGKFSLDVQSANTTLPILRKIGYFENQTFTPQELAEALKVDAVLSGNIIMKKPMSTGAAVVTTILFGFGTTNEATATLELHDRATGKMYWNFNHRVSGGLLQSASSLVNEIMRVASKKLPYSEVSSTRR